MTIEARGVRALHAGALLEQPLRIPPYQRPYRWTPATARQLLDDICDAQDQKSGMPYVLGTVILHAQDGMFDVVDGQQRLLTLRMLLAALQDEPLLPTPAPNPAPTPVHAVWAMLLTQARHMAAEQRQALHAFLLQRCQFVLVETNDVDEAFRVFDSQNYRGKPLAPHDLLKAHHLRAMRQESPSMQTALVEAWESARDAALDQLFSRFLYRIARWSRGESAPGFSVHDIDMFKGITPQAQQRPSPHQRYHLAAQAALPLLQGWGTQGGAETSDAERREAQHSRFQLDAPLQAGRPFFEMVGFMLQELQALESELPECYKPFGPGQHRYRYVHELFLAALLYYTNKFGHEALGETRHQLFRWAYALRVALLRVQFQSMDNRARGKEGPGTSPFVLLRHSATGRALRQLPTALTPYNDTHEKELIALLQELHPA